MTNLIQVFIILKDKYCSRHTDGMKANFFQKSYTLYVSHKTWKLLVMKFFLIWTPTVKCFWKSVIFSRLRLIGWPFTPTLAEFFLSWRRLKRPHCCECRGHHCQVHNRRCRGWCGSSSQPTHIIVYPRVRRDSIDSSLFTSMVLILNRRDLQLKWSGRIHFFPSLSLPKASSILRLSLSICSLSSLILSRLFFLNSLICCKRRILLVGSCSFSSSFWNSLTEFCNW